MPSRAKRTDANQSDIIKALKKVGASVVDLSEVGHGCPDLAIGFRKKNYFFEVKTEKGKLNNLQGLWHKYWNGQVAVVNSPENAVDTLLLLSAVDHSWKSDI